MKIIAEQKKGHNIIRLFANENEYIVYHYNVNLGGSTMSVRPFTDYNKAIAEYNRMVARYK